MKRTDQGFTLMEILIAMTILIVGLVGILALFPVGLNATRKAIEDSNAALIAESLYASLRAAAKETTPGGKMCFFYDGISDTGTNNQYPPGVNFTHTSLTKKAFGIPSHSINGTSTTTTLVDLETQDYRVIHATSLLPLEAAFCKLGRIRVGNAKTSSYDMLMGGKDHPGQLSQYSFNIEISYPDTNPKGLYDVVIRICRRKRLVKKFYSQVMIPTE